MHDKTIQACCIYLSAYYKISQGNVKNVSISVRYFLII